MNFSRLMVAVLPLAHCWRIADYSLVAREPEMLAALVTQPPAPR